MKRKGISAGLKLKVLERDKFTCQYCGKRAHERPLEIDHVIPISKGGTNDFDNLITACRECNRGKKDRILKEIPLEKRMKIMESSVKDLYEILTLEGILVPEGQEERGTKDLSGETKDLIYEWGSGHRLALPNTPETREMFERIVMQTMSTVVKSAMA